MIFFLVEKNEYYQSIEIKKKPRSLNMFDRNRFLLVMADDRNNYFKKLN